MTTLLTSMPISTFMPKRLVSSTNSTSQMSYFMISNNLIHLHTYPKRQSLCMTVTIKGHHIDFKFEASHASCA